MLKKLFTPLTQSHPQQIRGVLILAIAAFISGSLLSFSPTDASFNRASSNDIANIFGTYGAYIADPLIQLTGLASAIIAFSLLTISLRYIFLSPPKHITLNLACLLLATITGSSLLATATTPSQWPFYVSLGGIIGDLIFNHLPNIITIYGYYTATILTFTTSLYIALDIKTTELKTTYNIICKTINFIKTTTTNLAIASINIIRKIQKKELLTLKKTKPTTAKNTTTQQDNIIEFNKPKTKRKRIIRQTSLKLDPCEYELPEFELLTETKEDTSLSINQKSLEHNAKMLKKVLEDFGVNGEITKVRPGPVVTLYELVPSPGTKSSRVIGLADDIARSMSSISARISVIPGRNALGIELPNANRDTVYLRELMETEQYRDERVKLPIALGKDIGGEVVMTDLARMPHLLIAGTTGSGKSVAVNAMILSYLYRLSPDECKFIMIDPKMLELSVYEGIPHLLSPVVTEPKKAVVALKWAVREMENRYRLMSHLGVRNISGYNKRIEESIKKGKVLDRTVQTGFDPETGDPIFEKQNLDMNKMPFIVIIVDEMADLMLTAGKEIESSIQRLAQMARAAGIHMVMATQRPSVDVITGVIKANFPTRISFQVTSRIDSRTILGEMGAEQLLGMGDMLYMSGGGRVMRVHGPFVDDSEVEKVVKHLKSQGKPNYIEDVTKADDSETDSTTDNSQADIYDQAVAIVLRDKKASTSYIQRQLKIGYNRAANLIDKMEAEGVISPANHSGKREVLAA